MQELTAQFIAALSIYVFYYPIFMAHVWVLGALMFYLKWERRDALGALAPYPAVSILVPCHNEGENVKETIGWLFRQQYPVFEIIAIDDGSTDDTGKILDALAKDEPRLRVIHLNTNQGKAMALRMGAMVSRSEYLVCIDGDALLAPDAIFWIVRHFVHNPRVGAVTGNPRVRNRTTLLGKVQVGEFSSIIGLIKRAQRIYGRLFTVAGVIAAFRKSALHRVGYWSTDMLTEDVDISWKLQRDCWDIRFEPRASCLILMPETLRGLWRQRLRWARGGMEVLIKNIGLLCRWRERRMWVVLAECIASLLWVYVLSLLLLLAIASSVLQLPAYLHVDFLPTFDRPKTSLLAFTVILQFGVGYYLDRHYENGLAKYYSWIIWYPLVYWIIIASTSLFAMPYVLRKRAERATWVSPDRGLNPWKK